MDNQEKLTLIEEITKLEGLLVTPEQLAQQEAQIQSEYDATVDEVHSQYQSALDAAQGAYNEAKAQADKILGEATTAFEARKYTLEQQKTQFLAQAEEYREQLRTQYNQAVSEQQDYAKQLEEKKARYEAIIAEERRAEEEARRKAEAEKAVHTATVTRRPRINF